MSNTTSRHRRFAVTVALTAAVTLGLAACGADETIDAGAGGTPTNDEPTLLTDDAAPEIDAGAGGTPASNEPTQQTDDAAPEEDPIADPAAPEPTGDASNGITPLTPRTDLIQLQPATPDEVIVDPANDRQLLVRFQGAAEPCSGAAITVAETDNDVTIVLDIGFDPNFDAMDCIPDVFEYEITVPLDAPLGERTINA